MSFGVKKRGFVGMFGKESATNYEVYLNLTPLMDVMSNILFFLLAAFGASIVSILSATIPVQSDTPADAPEEDVVTLAVRADATGLSVSCDSQTMSKDKLEVCRSRIPKRGGDYDYAAFTTALLHIKERFPGSATMVLVPEDNARYETLVKVMDAGREVDTGGRKRVLFPDVVLSQLVK